MGILMAFCKCNFVEVFKGDFVRGFCMGILNGEFDRGFGKGILYGDFLEEYKWGL